MLSEETTAGVMKALNLSFNMWGTQDTGASNRGYWLKALAEAGMTDANAKRLREAFCRAWDGVTAPTLHAFCRWIRDFLAGEQESRYRGNRAGLLPVGSPVVGRALAGMRETLRRAKAERVGAAAAEPTPPSVAEAMEGYEGQGQGEDVPDGEIPF